MGFYNRLFGKKKNHWGNKTFPDEAYEINAEVRRKKAELRRLELDLELEEKRQMLDDMRREAIDVVDNPEQMLFNILSRGFTQAQVVQPAQPIPTNPLGESPDSSGLHLSREQIEAFFKNLPLTQRALIKYASEDDIKKAIIDKIPNISQETLKLCVEVAKK